MPTTAPEPDGCDRHRYTYVCSPYRCQVCNHMGGYPPMGNARYLKHGPKKQKHNLTHLAIRTVAVFILATMVFFCVAGIMS